MKKKYGFTFIEILAVIIVIGLLSILVIPQVKKISVNSKIKLCKNKLSLIEENVSLWLSNNNSCLSVETYLTDCPIKYNSVDFSAGKFITSLSEFAKIGVIDYDNGKIIKNPVNNENINNYSIEIDYNDKIGVSILDKNGNIDSGHNTICESNKNDIGNDKDANPVKMYNYYTIYKCLENSCKYYSKEKLNIKTSFSTKCQNILGTDAANYQYKNFDKNEIDQDNYEVKCNYIKKIVKYKLNTNYDVGIEKIEINPKKNVNIYSKGESILINYKLKSGYVIDRVECNINGTNYCSVDQNNNSISITMPESDLNVNIKTKKQEYSITVQAYLENADDNKYPLKSSYTKTYTTTDLSNANLLNYCKTNFSNSSYTINDSMTNVSNKTVNCYYSRKKFTITMNSAENVETYSFNPNSTSYKWGQTINLNYNFKTRFSKDRVECSISSSCTDIDDNNTKIIMPKSNLTVNIYANEADYILKKFLENTNDENYAQITKDEYISSSSSIDTICANNTPVGFTNSTHASQMLSYIDSENKVIYCYYSRNKHTLTYDFSNQVDLGGSYTPRNDSKFYTPGTAYTFDTPLYKEEYEPQTATYKYGQEIILSTTFNQGYETDRVECKNSYGAVITGACKTVDKLTYITMPNEDITVKPIAKELKETVNIKVFLENPNDENFVENVKTTFKTKANVVYKNNEKDMLKEVCSTPITNKYADFTGFEFNERLGENLSYVDWTGDLADKNNKTFYCYYSRIIHELIYDFSDKTDQDGSYEEINDSKFYTPGTAYTFDTPLHNNVYEPQKTTYKYGQEIILSTTFNQGYETDRVECKNSYGAEITGACKTVDKLTYITMPNQDMIVKPIAKVKEEVVKIKVFLENPNDENFVENINSSFKSKSVVVYKNKEKEMLKEVCSTPIENKYADFTGFEFNERLGENLSYVDWTGELSGSNNKVFYCYYSRNKHTLTYDFSNQVDLGGNYTPRNDSKFYTPGTAYTFDTPTYKEEYREQTATYKYGQEIILSTTFNQGYETDRVECKNSYGAVITGACKTVDKLTYITMPNEDITVKPIAKELKETVNIKVFLENPNDENFVENVKTTFKTKANVVYKNNEKDMLKEVCSTPITNKYADFTGFEFNERLGENLSYVDWTGDLADKNNKTFYCYYSRIKYTLKYELTDAKITNKFYTPNGAYTFGSTSPATTTTSYIDYKYGQEIKLVASTFSNGYKLSGVNCLLNNVTPTTNICTITGNIIHITMPASALTVKPIAGPS